jgi:hypothetical protein
MLAFAVCLPLVGNFLAACILVPLGVVVRGPFPLEQLKPGRAPIQ